MSEKLRYYKQQYCKDIENVENFEKALADDFKGWHCHHRRQTWDSNGERLEVDISAAELIALDIYYDVPAEELIFMKHGEHSSLHSKGNQHAKGKHQTEEAKRKNREAHLGKNNPMYGKRHSIESRRKMSEAKKSVEAKKRMSEAATERNTGRHWYHNDKGNKFCYECPPGYEPGYLMKKKALVKGEQ